MSESKIEEGSTMVLSNEIPGIKADAVRSLAPSHIEVNGSHVYLPVPGVKERDRFFERSVVRLGLLEADMMGTKKVQKETEDESENGTDADSQKIHPLAVASARLQANGIAELNRAVNLAGLVDTGEYFGISTIVDPLLEAENEATNNDKTPKAGTEEVIEEQKVRSTYVLKRKRDQFEKAASVLDRHEKRLRAAIAAQTVVDQRLFQLRRNWRLVAPEHGTRARLHNARPTEVIAIDVDVYDRDRVGGGSQAILRQSAASLPSLAGRLASRVPRFATIELNDNFDASQVAGTKDTESDGMEIDSDQTVFTRAEPFQVADPTLGRIHENFDPTKVPMLTLQLDIQRAASGVAQSARLAPLHTLSLSGDNENLQYSADEQLVVSLQHSLFCAHLFESMRKELDPEDLVKKTDSQARTGKVRWLSCEADKNFLPPVTSMIGGDSGRAFSAVAVIHCHAGEVKVQLDEEYTMSVKLVETNGATDYDANGTDAQSRSGKTKWGSQSSAQLHALCRALLLHAQTKYHHHSLSTRKRIQAIHARLSENTEKGLERSQEAFAYSSPRILQSCVGLGAKVIFEGRVRRVLAGLSATVGKEDMTLVWNDLPLLSHQSQFTLCLRTMTIDATIVRDTVTCSILDKAGCAKKVTFCSDKELEAFLKLNL